MAGTLFVVATPIGNLEDITARALRVLREAAIIAAEDTRRTEHLLARYAITTATTSLHEHNETRKLPTLIARLRRGEHVALVSDAGTPTISDPGGRLVRAAIDAGIRVEPLPGPSAIVTALAGSGLAADSFTFLGFPPTRSKDREAWFDALGTVRGVAVFFEAPHRIRETLETVLARMGDLDVAVGRELTKVHEEFVRGTVSEVLRTLTEPRGEFTIVLAARGHSTKYGVLESSQRPTETDLAREFGEMTASERLPRRVAISRLARRHGLSPNSVYRALEESKKFRPSDR